MIQFVDLKCQYDNIKNEIDDAIFNVISNTAFIGGSGNRFVNEFEQSFAKYIGIKHTIGCANGTDALEVSLESMNLKPGDEVLVPAMSWISSSEAITTQGGTPIFVDINPESGVINENQIQEKITNRTKGIIVVHLYGNPCEMDTILRIAQKHSLFIIEDCAQAHGATYKDRTVGTFGDLATYSFYPGKNLGAYGDAGAIVTDSDELAEKCRVICNHGQLGQKHNHISEGRNSRLDGIQAAVLNVKLKYIAQWTQLRQEKAQYYLNNINSSKIECLSLPNYSTSVYHLFVIKTKNRKRLIKKFEENSIGYGIHYPKALPFLQPYLDHKSEVDVAPLFPYASGFQNEILSIPIYPEISTEDQNTVIDVINNF